MSDKIWFKKKRSGPPAQRLWQMAVGGAIFVAFVGIPLTTRLYRNQQRKIAEREGTLVNPLQQMVYEQRLAVRKSLQKDLKDS